MRTLKNCCVYKLHVIILYSLLLQECLECLVVPHEHHIAAVKVDEQRAGKPTKDPARDMSIQ